MINENNNALEIEIFLPFFPRPSQPFRGTAVLTAGEQCEVWFVASLFFALRFPNLYPGAEPTPAGAERVGRSLRGAIAPRPTFFFFFFHPSYISAEVTSVDVISYGKFLITALFTLRRPRFKSSVRPPLRALCSPLIEPIIPPRGTGAALLLQMTP